MTPAWFRNWKIIYDAVPAHRIDEFEVVEDGVNITLLEHSDPVIYWMVNCASEWRLYKMLHRFARGNVLIAGLGLGFDILSIADKDSVNNIVIVEKNRSIIDLVWPYIPHNKSTLVFQDVSEYLAEIHETFDIIYFDIFPGGSEFFPEEVAGLEALARTKLKPDGKIIFFKETFVPAEECQEVKTNDIRYSK